MSSTYRIYEAGERFTADLSPELWKHTRRYHDNCTVTLVDGQLIGHWIDEDDGQPCSGPLWTTTLLDAGEGYYELQS